MGERRRYWNPRSAGGKVVSGRKGPILPATLVCHTRVVLWSNPAQHFGHGTRLTVLGKMQDPGCRVAVSGTGVSVSPLCPDGRGRLNSDPRGASEELGLPSLYLFFNINLIYSWLCWVFVAMRAFP